LVEALKDPDEDMRQGAAGALGEIGGSNPKGFLAVLLQKARRKNVPYQQILEVAVQVNLRIEPWEMEKELAKQRRKREQAQRKEKIIVKEYHIHGRFNKCILNIDSNLTQATQALNAAPEQVDRDELRQLLEELREELKKVPPGQIQSAEEVSKAGRDLLKEATKPSPNKRSIKISAKGLIEAAMALAVVVPTVLPVANKIAELVSRWFR
jgi:HEAT repeat protein